MKPRLMLLAGSLPLILASCTEEYDCEQVQIQPAFVGYSLADLQTLVIRRYQAHDSYRTLLDSVVLRQGENATYLISADTIVVVANLAIREGFDWQLRVPATGKTVLLSDIVTEPKTGQRTHGIFSLDPAPPCVNRLVSLQVDSQTIPFAAKALGNGFRVYIYP